MQAKVVLLCGYRRTGKDSLYSILSSGEVSDNLFKWRIYRNPSKLNTDLNGCHSYFRTSFADALKREASEKYGIPLVISDTNKDIKQFIHYKSGELMSARDIYIEWGTIRRAENIDYWCKTAFNNIPNDPNTTCVVTDWRYLTELKHVFNLFHNVVTVRLYRSDVSEPPANIDSEHNLDTYATDIVLIQNSLEGEFEKVVKKFPQYTNYIRGECIN